MAESLFLIEQLLNNPDVAVNIHMPSSSKFPADTVTGYMSRPIEIGGNNDFNSPDIAGSQHAASDVVNAAYKAINAIAGAHKAMVLQKNLGQTILAWTGSGKPQFHIALMFFAVRIGDDPTIPWRKLMRGVLPTAGNGIWPINQIVSPLEYSVDPARATATGTSMLEIGQWFQADGLIIRDVRWTASVEITSQGTPLYAEGTVTMEPFRTITIDEFEEYFMFKL
jgi:hypothetical protein